MGPRLRRMRRDLGLTQGGMAADLGVSVSYVSLIESNQRPVTTELLLRLARTYKIDLSDLAGDGGAEFTARLQAALRDPLFADIDLPSIQTADVATGFPGITEAFLRLHTAYLQEQVALADRHASSSEGDGLSDPVVEVRRFLTARRNSFPALDDAAEKIAVAVETAGGLVPYIEARHSLRVRIMSGGMIRRYDPHHAAIFLDEGLSETERRFQLALQIAYLELASQIDALAEEGKLGSQNAVRLARRALASYAGAAMLMPYDGFARAAVGKRYDVEALARQFGASFEQVAHRLTTLQRPGSERVPFFLVRVDAAGNVSKRLDSTGRPFAMHAGGCPLWNLHQAFRTPGQVLTQWLALPDGEQFFSIARTVRSGTGGYGAYQVERAVALVCATEHAPHLIYNREAPQPAATPIGIACTLCHRDKCPARAAPPIGRHILPDDYHRRHAPFGFADD